MPREPCPARCARCGGSIIVGGIAMDERFLHDTCFVEWVQGWQIKGVA